MIGGGRLILTELEKDIVERVSKAKQDGVIYITAEEFAELYGNKKVSLEHYTGDGLNAEWVYRSTQQPITVDGDKLTIGDKAFDATHIELITRYGVDPNLPDKDKHAIALMTFLMAYGDLDRGTAFERGRIYVAYHTLCRARAISSINGYEFSGKYAAAECGDIITIVPINGRKGGRFAVGKKWGTPLKPGLDKKRRKGRGCRYRIVNLTDVTGKARCLSVHRIIAKMFVPNDSNDNIYVNHRDANSLNNAADNLEWCTPAYNSKYSVVFHALQKALPDIDCHEWLDDCHDLTEKVLNQNDDEKTELIAAAAVQIAQRICNNRPAE